MRIVAVTNHPTGRRFHLLELRTHHGTWGTVAILWGALWCWKDRADFREWFAFRREFRP